MGNFLFRNFHKYLTSFYNLQIAQKHLQFLHLKVVYYLCFNYKTKKAFYKLIKRQTLTVFDNLIHYFWSGGQKVEFHKIETQDPNYYFLKVRFRSCEVDFRACE